MKYTLLRKNQSINIEKNKKFFVKSNKKNRNIFLSFLPQELIIKKVEINKNIKQNLIKSIIEAKISKEIEEKFVFYYFLESSDEENNIFRVEIIKLKDILNAINSLKKESIKFITTDFHSLFNVSKQYFNDYFISIFVDKDNVIYVCGKDKLQYFREISIKDMNEESIAQDIKRTIIYFKQQLKILNLENILISGNNEFINNIIDSINEQLSIPLNFFIKNINQNEFLENFILFGLLFSKENFLPQQLQHIQTFNKFFIFLTIVLLIINGYFAINLYQKYEYSNLLNDILISKKNKFYTIKKHTNIFPASKIEYLVNFLTLKNTSSKSKIFVNKLLIIKPIFNILKLQKLNINNVFIHLTFSKQYKSFKKLIFEKKYIEDFLNKKNIKYLLQTNYQNNEILLKIILKRDNV